MDNATQERKQRSVSDWLGLYVRGLAMGAADVVPGVSGGTIAFITGIYSELLHSLSRFDFSLIGMLKRDGIAGVWRHVNASFLLVLFAGVLTSLISLAKVIKYAMQHHPIMVWSFFFGLILASIWYFAKRQSAWRWRDWLGCVLGAIFVVGIALSAPAQLPGYWWMMFLGGFVAICAMILPGVSGSFLLLLVGLYPVFIDALSDFDLVLLLSFGVGAGCGLLVFSRFLSWLLDHFERPTMATLIGFLVGSLFVTWPWKVVVQTRLNSKGQEVPWIQENVYPWVYGHINGVEPGILSALACLLFGVFLVLFTEYISGLKKKNNE